MATNDADISERTSAGETPLMGRLSRSRWLIVGSGALLAVLAAAGMISLAAALVIFAGFVVLTALIRRDGPVTRPAILSPPVDQTWPDTGIKLFAESLPDPCMVLDRRGIVRFINRRAVEAFSIKTGEPLTSRLRAPDLIAAFDRVAKGGAAEGVEFAERVPTERWFAAWFARLDPGARGGRFVVLIIDDLTERRRSERIRVDFVANASHELRTPLASLAGFIETLQGPARDDAVARQRFLKIMQDQALRMSRLVDDLLSLSRIEMKAHVKPSGEVDLAGTVRHVGDALEPLARELGVAIETNLPAGPINVLGDRDELVQVFENLIENACKYGQSGGRVVVMATAATEGGGPSVAVSDFGPGIAEEHLPRLTERFYRVDVEESRQHRGTGLGLAIVKHILARHQARLTIESRLGEGATFRVTFPQGSSAAEAEPEQNSDINQIVKLS
jgi:two-component system, OmpR family, phosphate regulon sensor histidine kinase PhoR